MCKKEMQVFAYGDPAIYGVKCSLCSQHCAESYYSCQEYDLKKKNANLCQFLTCVICFQDIQQMEKLKLMAVMRENNDKEAFNDNMEYIMGIFRKFMSHDP